ncbi:hypothetical protein SAZ_30350 [Streptomyces noursei ZPM]|uniref:Uncharacterized protein n=1 Tax=Streptomyces noursei TaxID=1971 RepID=A0A401R8C2_STRNR|nr:hypothetical protein [Streptomyces noursei]AKA08916.1 hypothetical protein SAZ_30350 [Streptomyces noursei ZPM]EOT03705.1 hypothetical protein K530_12302 [Streptomyces noursei CCRC 11814]EXU87282.1 hypothetical protein P354_37170 [Streptomyces noursei PD-1]UWS74660.1 hypothetical protein N1H47_27500 [Streptomyces noursei]GCB93856.1 hypothetical protein SALB_06647 [Streptomyces noursei]
MSLFKFGRRGPVQSQGNHHGNVTPDNNEVPADRPEGQPGDDSGLRNAIARGTAEGGAREAMRELINQGKEIIKDIFGD